MAYYLTYGDATLFDPYTTNTVTDAKLTAKTNNPDYLDFTIPYTHECCATIQERGALVTLKWDDTVLFFGEVDSVETDFEGNKTVSCVGGLDWLNSTVVRPYSTIVGEAQNVAPTTVEGLFAWYVDQHNAHVLDSRKAFVVGVNQGANLVTNNYIYRSSSDYASTWDEISSQIIDELGGYVYCTYDPLTVHLYSDIHSTNTQIIDFGVNLLDFTKTVDTSSQATAVLPTGPDLYFHVRFSDTPTPATSEDISDSPKTYIGTYVDTESGDETDYPMVYSWQLYSSSRGSSGADGILGCMTDGTMLYLHVAWAYDSAGENGFSKTDYTDRGYIGQYVDYSVEGSTDCHRYSWEEFSPVTYDADGKENTSGSGVHGPNSHQGPTLGIDNLADIQTEYSPDFYKHGDVVYSRNGVNRYGYIEYQYSNTDCLLPKTLLTAACKALNTIISPITTIELSAVDLALYMDGYEHLSVGQAVRIRSNYHGVDEYLMVESIDLDLLDPSGTTYTLGGEYDTLTGQQNKYLKSLNTSIDKSLDKVAALSDEVKSSAKDISAVESIAMTAEKTAIAAQSVATQTSDSLAGTIIKYDQEFYDLQKQVDGTIETWFYAEPPSLMNAPANEWETDSDRNKHLGDLYYDTDTGYCYRWQNQNGVYSWSRIADTDVTKALDAAKNAQDTADHKRTIFVDTPTTPYEIGDLWVQGESGDILRCMTSKTKDGSYSAGDWSVASKYTDDTKAEEANIAAEAAKTTANEAKEAADNAATNIVTQYAASESPTVEPTSGWSQTAPTYADNQYIWIRNVVTYGSGEVTTTNPALITGNTGAKGDTGEQGETGASVSSLAVEYYLSTSDSTQTGGSWQGSVPEWESDHYIWQRSVTTIKLVDGTTTIQISDPVLYGVMNSLAKTVDGHTTQVTQNANSINTLIGRTDSLDTLIHESSEGIEVGKSKDGETYDGYHTLVGTDSFQIHDTEHLEVLGIHADKLSETRTVGEIVSPSLGGLALSSGTRSSLPEQKNIMGITYSGAWCRLKNSTAEIDFSLEDPDSSYAADLTISLNGGTLNLGGTIGITNFPTGSHAQTTTISYEQLLKMLTLANGVATNTDQVTGGSVIWTRNANTVVGYAILDIKYYQSTWDESPAFAIGLPNNTAGSNRCGVFHHDCNNGSSELIVTTSGELKCYRRGEEITAGSTIYGSFCYPTY